MGNNFFAVSLLLFIAYCGIFPLQLCHRTYINNIHADRYLCFACVVILNLNYQRSKSGYWRKIHSMLWHNSS